MAEEIIRRCDYKVGRGRNAKPHGELIGDSTRFKVDNREYLVDICDEHKEALMASLRPFIDISRRAGTALPRNSRGRAIMRAKGGKTFTTKDVRVWLQQQPGVTVGESGRIPNEQIEMYKQAHGL